jgi:hypothetical protein
VAKIIFEFFIGVGSDSQRPNLKNFRIEKSLGIRFHILDQGLDKILGLAAGGMDENSIAAMDMAEDLRFGPKFFRVDPLHLFANFILYF